MKRQTVCLGLGLLLLLLVACSIPVSAGTTGEFDWRFDSTTHYLDISPKTGYSGSIDLTPTVVEAIRVDAGGFSKGDVHNLSLSSSIPKITANTFQGYNGLTSVIFTNATAIVENNAFPSNVNRISTGVGISSITTRWGAYRDNVEFTYSAVHNESVTSVLKITSVTPVTINYGTPVCSFIMPPNEMSLEVITDNSSGPTSAGTSVSFLICKVNITSDPGITFNVTPSNPSTVVTNESGTISVILNGTGETLSVTVTSSPAGHIIEPIVTNISGIQWTVDQQKFTLKEFTKDADYGYASIHITSTPAPVPPGPSPTYSPPSHSGTPEDQQTKVNPWNPLDTGQSSEAAIDGIVTSSGDNRATVEDVSSTYPGVTDAANAAISMTAATLGVSSGSLDSLTASSGLSSEAAAKVNDILTNAVEKGIITPSQTTAPLIIDIGGGSSSDATPVKFYKVFDITPYSGEDSLRQVDFEVPVADITAAGCTESDVVLYHGYPDDNLWVPLETAVTGSDGTTAHYSAKTNGASPFAIVFTHQEIVIQPGEPIDGYFASPWTNTIRIIVTISIILAVLAVGAVIVFTVVRRSNKNPYQIYQRSQRKWLWRRK